MIPKTLKGLAVIMIISLAFSTGAAMADETLPVLTEEMIRQTVIFHTGTPVEEIDSHILTLEAQGYVLFKRVPFINGVVVGIPEALSPPMPGYDPRVAEVINDQTMELQTLTAAGDGGADTDGTYDDGTVYYTTLQDGTTLTTSTWEAYYGTTETSTITYISPVTETEEQPLDITRKERPHGILKLKDHPFDPHQPLSPFNESNLAEIILDADQEKRLSLLKVAIFDTGVDTTHTKLNYSNEKSGVIGGIDLVNMKDGIPVDDNGHGTHVAGTLIGDMFGMAPGVKLHMVKVLDENAAGEISTLIMALQWCIDKSISVINMSIAYREDNPTVHRAIQKAHEAGIIMIAAAGNHSNWIDDEVTSGDGGAGDGGAGDGGADDGGVTDENPWPVMYPAAYPEVIAVGAIDSWGEVASFSNLGPEIDVMAPGTDIFSSTLGNGYGIANGTSMACPHIAGAVALMKSLDFNKRLTPDIVKNIIRNSHNPDGSLNLYEALHKVQDLQ